MFFLMTRDYLTCCFLRNVPRVFCQVELSIDNPRDGCFFKNIQRKYSRKFKPGVIDSQSLRREDRNLPWRGWPLQKV
jgi:hypothetical protein